MADADAEEIRAGEGCLAVSVSVRADKQIILAPVSRPASALKGPCKQWTGMLEGPGCSLMSSSCTSGAMPLFGFRYFREFLLLPP